MGGGYDIHSSCFLLFENSFWFLSRGKNTPRGNFLVSKYILKFIKYWLKSLTKTLFNDFLLRQEFKFKKCLI